MRRLKVFPSSSYAYLLGAPLAAQSLPASPPQISPRRMRELADGKRAEASALEGHRSPYQDSEDRNTRSAQGHAARRAAQLRTEATQLEQQAQEAEQATQ